MTKRVFDILVGTVLAILALPVILVLALFSAAMFRCWPFFVQQRVGMGGRRFHIVKIRTLPPCAPKAVDKFAVAAMPLPRWATALRSSHMDELPQLFLVPLGRMSLVGPRPEMPFLHDQGDATFAKLRTTVRPGCTGLWQVSRAADRLIWQASEFDVMYLRERTLRMDLWILARTPLLAVRRAALEIDDIPRWTRAARRPANRSAATTVAPWNGANMSSPPTVIDLRDTRASQPPLTSPISD